MLSINIRVFIFLFVNIFAFFLCRPDGGGGEGGGGAEGGGGGEGHLHPPRQAHVRHCRRAGVRYEPLLAAVAAAHFCNSYQLLA